MSRAGRTAVLQSGTTLEADFLLLGVGVRPLVALMASDLPTPSAGRVEVVAAVATSALFAFALFVGVVLYRGSSGLRRV